MKAMVLAAGLGTRLRPLTDDRPKALVEIGGRTLLEITLTRLRSFGVNEVIVNVHHFADKVIAYLRDHQNFGMRIEISREDDLLDTGGGLKQAAPFFLMGDNSDPQPFILHNVDVISTIDLARMVQAHRDTNALATLAVQDRKTSRYLLFNRRMELCGRRAANQEPELSRPAEDLQPLAFAGIHVISPRLLPMLTETGAFSIITSYLRLAAHGESIRALRADDVYWRDLGRPESLSLAEQEMKQHGLM